MPQLEAALAFILPLSAFHQCMALRTWHIGILRLGLLREVKFNVALLRQLKRCLKHHSGFCDKARNRSELLLRQKLTHLILFELNARDLTDREFAAVFLILNVVDTAVPIRCDHNLALAQRAFGIL